MAKTGGGLGLEVEQTLSMFVHDTIFSFLPTFMQFQVIFTDVPLPEYTRAMVRHLHPFSR